MAWRPLPFGQKIYRNLPAEALTEMSARLIDGIPNVARNIMKRPGIAAWADTTNATASVDGLLYWPNNNVVIAVCNSNIYSIDSSGTVTLRASAVLLTGERVSFVDVGDTLYMANGDKIVKLTSAYAASYIYITGHLTAQVNSLTSVNKKLIAGVVGEDRLYYTAAGVYDTFSGTTDSFTATSNPDDCTQIWKTKSGVIAFGPHSIEPHYDTGSTTFQFRRDNGAVLDVGCIAPESVQEIDNTFYFLNEKRKVSRWPGTGLPEILSTPFDDVIQGFNTVSNAKADVYRIWGVTLYVLSFPTPAVTLVYSVESDEWFEWAHWDQSAANYDNYLGSCYLYVSEWNKHLVGGRNNGKIGLMSKTTYQDWGDTIRTMYRTGHIDHGNYGLEKQSDVVCLHVKKGVGSYSAAAKSAVRYRDNNGLWGNEIELNLGFMGEQEFYLDLIGNGYYRCRQYEFIHTHNSEFILFGGMESIANME